MMIRRVWIKTNGDNASTAITDHGKRRVTLLNSSASAPPRPLRSADGGPLFPADWDAGQTSPRVSKFCALLLRRWQAFLKLRPCRQCALTIARHPSRRLPISSSIYCLWRELSLRAIRQCSDVFLRIPPYRSHPGRSAPPESQVQATFRTSLLSVADYSNRTRLHL